MHAGLQVRVGDEYYPQDVPYLTMHAVEPQMPSVSVWDRSEPSHTNQSCAASPPGQQTHMDHSQAYDMCKCLGKDLSSPK